MVEKSLRSLLEAREHNPFHLLGVHRDSAGWRLRVLRPYARSVAVAWAGVPEPQALTRVHAAGIFEWRGELPLAAQPPALYQLILDEDGSVQRQHDAYAFPPEPPADDLYLFNEGRNFQAYHLLGARQETRREIAGVRFLVWAINAYRVAVVGDFNRWDGRVHPMATLGASGVWELFIPGLDSGTLYKFELRNRHNGAIAVKADPYARR
ncbi:MAG: 1,4-alpha-glucan branching enzyme, partial [Proteobacteria bacterium]|nr:1,4-alpha-glucan branching enzyme [Pseudomonadota bacterium]